MSPTLCDHCALANVQCEVYPLETTRCVSFKSIPDKRHKKDACLLIAAGLRASADVDDQQSRFSLLCRVIQEDA